MTILQPNYNKICADNWTKQKEEKAKTQRKL